MPIAGQNSTPIDNQGGLLQRELAPEAYLSCDTEHLTKVDDAAPQLESDRFAAFSVFRGQAEIGPKGLI